MRFDPDNPDPDIPELETFDMIQKVSGMLPNEWKEWPPVMREALLKSVDELNGRRLLDGKSRLAIASSHCARDEEGWYVHVILQPAWFLEPAESRA